MFVTAQAGVEHLWIDSLCIIQDCDEDWQSESVKMGEIYRNGICNLASTGFVDGSSGLFVDRVPQQLRPIPITLSADIRLGNDIVLSEGRYQLVDYESWTTGVDEAPLNTRAWVVQERMLSPRTIHFGTQQIFWECCEKICSEVYARGFPENLIGINGKLDAEFVVPVQDANSASKLSVSGLERRRRFEELEPASKHQILMSNHKKNLLRYQWWKILWKYARGALTRPEDRLVALAGLAKALQPHMNSKYLAGLWEDCLIDQLLWTLDMDQPNENPIKVEAPSWTWASTTANFYMYGYQPALPEEDVDPESSLAVVDRASVKIGPSGPFGHITKGSLTITGGLCLFINFPYRINDSSIRHEFLSKTETTQVELDLRIDDEAKMRGLAETYLLHKVVPRMGFSLESDNVIFAMPLKIQEDSETGSPELCGLLLRPLTSSKGVYKRIGIFSTQYDPEEEALNLFKARGFTANIPQRFHQGGVSEGKYTIEIV